MRRHLVSLALLAIAVGCSSSSSHDGTSRDARAPSAPEDGSVDSPGEPDDGAPGDAAIADGESLDAPGRPLDASAVADAGRDGDAGAVIYSNDSVATENP